MDKYNHYLLEPVHTLLGVSPDVHLTLLTFTTKSALCISLLTEASAFNTSNSHILTQPQEEQTNFRSLFPIPICTGHFLLHTGTPILCTDCPEHFPDCPEIFHTVQKFSRLFQTVWKYSRLSGNIQDIWVKVFFWNDFFFSWKTFGTAKTFHVAILPCYQGFSLSATNGSN